MSTITMATPARVDPALVAQGRADLSVAFRWAARLGMNEGIDNHFSLVVPGTTDRFLLNPLGFAFAELTPDRLVVVDTEGRVVEGEHAAETTAFYIHSRIHRAKPDARCVLHTHMPYATALGMLEGGRLEPCHQNALRFHGAVGYDPEFNGLALDEAEGDRLVAALGGHRILFLANHGVLVVGRTVAEAFDDLYYLERACQLQVLALSTGRPLRRVPEPIARLTARQFDSIRHLAELHLQALRRMLD